MVETFYVERPDCRLYCERRGSGPLMLLVHGIASDADYFSRTAEILSMNYTVVTYDRRGYSRSSVPERADYSLETQAEDAAGIIRKMNLGKAVVTGSSAGGIAAAETALRYPELVDRLILHEPVFAKEEKTGAEWEALMDKIYVCRESHRISRAMMAFIEAMGGVDSRSGKRPLSAQAQDLKNMQLFVDYEVDCMLDFSIDAAKTIPCPVLIMVGENDGDGLFHRAAAAAAETVGWPLLHVPGYHNLPQDLPLEFAVSVSGALSCLE